MTTSTATFEISMTQGAGELDGAAGRFDFTKTWSGAVEGTSRGFMASGGDPANGEAGYVALERVEGSLDGRRGSFMLQQSGTMHAGDHWISYVIVPGSGTDELTGLTGSITLTVTEDGAHTASINYDL